MSINRCATTLATGAASGGIVTVILDSQDVTVATLIIGALAALIACMVLCTAWLVDVIKTQHMLTISEIRSTNRPADQAYELGFEMGHGKGWNEAYDEIRAAQPVRKIGLAAVEEAAGS